MLFEEDANGNPVLDENGDPVPVRTNGRRPPPRAPDGGALTALVYAARAGSIDAARVLLEGGADVNQTTLYGWSPLLAATQNQNYQLAKFLIEHGVELWRWLQDGAHLYVCGDASRMAKDVDDTLVTIAQRHGGLSAEAAAEYRKSLVAQKRYTRDVY